MPIVEFIKNNYIVCIIVLGVTLIIGAVIAVILVKESRRKSRDKLEKIMSSMDIVYEDEIAVTEAVPQPKGDADFKWLREQTFGKDCFPEQEKTKDEVSDVKKTKVEEKKPVKEVKKAEVKTKKTAPVKAEVKKTEKPATKKTAPEKTAVKATPKKAVGKWVVREKGEGEFVAFLHANNGEIMLTSEIYSTADGARKGIATIKKSIAGDGFQLYCDKNRNYYFKLKNAQNRFLCVGETYPTKASCISAVDSVKRFAEAPVQDEVEKDLTQINYVVPKNEKTEKKTGYNGKWVIIDVEDMFIAQLFASNGELLLSSEAYTTAFSAKSAIETITTNGISGNFIIDADKKGRYFFKLRNAQKSTLCVGETYSQLAKCQSAIDSVRRFLKTAKLETTDND